MKVVKRKDLSQEEILSKVDDWTIFRYYIGDNFQVNRAICSPMRKDNNPSFSIFLSEEGRLRFIDFADDKYKGDAIDLVGQLYNLDYSSSLQKIALDFQLVNGTADDYKKIVKDYNKPILTKKRYTFIQVNTKPFTEVDLSYWGKYQITIEDLRKEQIYSVKNLFVNRKKRYVGKDELCFAYHYDGCFKIYFPERSKDKWVSNIPLSTVEGEIIPEIDKVLIVKSKKDRMCLQKIINGINIVSVQNESIACFTEDFTALLRGKDVWVSYDSDSPGKRASITITSKFGYRHINVPDKYLDEGIKDWSDLICKYGTPPVIEHFKQKGLI